MKKLSSPLPASVIYVTGCLFKLIECLRKRRALRRISRNNNINVFTSTHLLFTPNASNEREWKLRKSIVIKQTLATVVSLLELMLVWQPSRCKQQRKKFYFRFQFPLVAASRRQSLLGKWHPVSLFADFINQIWSIWIEITHTSSNALLCEGNFLSLHLAAFDWRAILILRDENYF